MQRAILALILSTLFLTACNTTVREAVSLRPDLENPDRLVCVDAHDEQGRPDERPALPPSYVIDWSSVTSVEQAREQHEAFVARVIARNEPVTGYIIKLEGRLFVCGSNSQWWKDYWSELPAPE